MRCDYVLILTKSSHSIDADAAAEITRALISGEHAVEIRIALYGDEVRRALINTSHIVALTEESVNSSPQREEPQARHLKALSSP
jgi:hypothetical protein